MECNREEAMRVKSIAEKKMESKDFVSAERLISKAQQLFPDLENLSQMLTVCTVHVSAETKFQTTEIDWYKILQVEPTENEASIKKQYRRLALLLHPDKNKFPGAESAFKLIGEAMRILLDQSKRALYDMKRRQALSSSRPSLPRRPAQPKNTATKKYPVFSTASVNHAAPQFAGFRPFMQPQPPSTAGTFWTMCPYCSIRYQYYNNIVNKPLKCQNCANSFIARDLNIPNVGFMRDNVPNRSSYPQQKSSTESEVTFGAHKIPQPGISKSTSFGANFQQNVSGVSTTSKQSTEVKDDPHRSNPQAENFGGAERVANMQKHNPNDKSSKKRRKVVCESSDGDSVDSEESDDIEEVNMEQQFQFGQQEGSSDQNPRRSSRNKKHVTYDENKSDDDDDTVSAAPNTKRSKRTEILEGEQQPEMDSSKHVDGTREDCKMNAPEGLDSIPQTENKLNSEKLETNNTNSSINGKGLQHEDTSESDEDDESSSEPKTFEVPEPEFYDFDADKTSSDFMPDQLWAVYDDLDGLPRFYAMVTKVLCTDFKLEIKWLESFPVGAKERAWKNADLPVGCGRFSFGEAMFTEDRLMFSHLTKCMRVSQRRRNYCLIYPRRGEIWAIFQDWDINWSSNPEKHKPFKYEVVEMLEDYTEDTGGVALPLVKVNGFQSLFKKMVNSTGSEVRWHIPGGQSCKFSHQVPAHRMEGGEKEGVPKGSYELDPAALPTDLVTAKNFGDEVGESSSKNNRTDPSSSSQHANEHKEYVFVEPKPTASSQNVKDEPKRKGEEKESVKHHHCDGLMNGVSGRKPTRSNGHQQPSDASIKFDTKSSTKSTESPRRVYTRQAKVILELNDNNRSR